MPPNTYAERVNITKYIKQAGKWRFAPVSVRPSGNIHWDYVLIDGVAEHHPEGKYFIEWREDGNRRRKSVGVVPSEVLTEARRKKVELNASAAGVRLATAEGTVALPQLLIGDAVERYLRDIKMNKAASTFCSLQSHLGPFQEVYCQSDHCRD